MNTAQAPDVMAALRAIFNKPATVKDGVVSVNTPHVSSGQFTLLAQASFALGVDAPAIARSGTGVKVAFSLTV